MRSSSTSALFFFVRAEWRVAYMSPHNQLPHIADRTTNWDSSQGCVRPYQKLMVQQPIATTSPGPGASIS